MIVVFILCFEGCCCGFYGFFCMECNKLCFICDVVNGECLFCIKFLYGEKCDKCCLYNCLDGKCDRNMGNCRGCDFGFDGLNC